MNVTPQQQTEALDGRAVHLHDPETQAELSYCEPTYMTACDVVAPTWPGRSDCEEEFDRLIFDG